MPCNTGQVDARAVVELARSSATASAFQQALLTELVRHIGADVGTVEIAGAKAPAVQGFRTDVVGDWHLARARHASELGPVLAAARTGATVDADVLGERRVQSTRYFAEVVRPHGGRDTLYALPAWDGEPTGCVLLGRCGPRGRFRRRDLDRVSTLLPTIALASMAVLKRARAAPPLSRRESEIVDLLRRGFRSKDIAGTLGSSPNTVRNQIWRLMARLGVATRAELIAVCRSDDG